MNNNALFLGLFLGICILFSCSKPHEDIDFTTINTLLRTNPDSAKKVLKTAISSEISHIDAREIDYWLLRGGIAYKRYERQASDSIMQIVAHEADEAEIDKQIMAHFLYACALKEADKRQKYVEELQQVALLGEQNKNADQYYVCRAHLELGDLFEELDDIDASIKEQELASKAAHQCHDTIIEAAAYCAMAYTYARNDEPINAEHYALKSYNCYKPISKEYAVSPLFCLIKLAIDNNELEKAHAIFRQIDDIGHITGLTCESDIIRYQCWHLYLYYKGMLLTTEEQHQEAEPYFREGLRLAHQDKKANSYLGLMLVYQGLMVPDSIVKYAQLYAHGLNANHIASNSKVFNRIQAEYAIDHYKDIAQQAQWEKERNLYLFGSGLTIVTILLPVLYLYRKKSRHLQTISSKVECFYNQIIKKSTSNKQKLSFQKFLTINKNPTDADWKLLQAEVFKNIPAFRDFILQNNITISQKENRICLLFLQEFRTQDIAKLLCCAPSTISTEKVRIYKKVTGETGNANDFERLLLNLKDTTSTTPTTTIYEENNNLLDCFADDED